MGRYVPRSGWAEQKTSRESCCGKTAIYHTCQPEFRRAKIVVLRSDASDKTAKQNESDDHFRLADKPLTMRRAIVHPADGLAR
jgi:hypothetical protein